jgi:NADP-dependent 3-hydroxy acid dehydrogenase YdfG
MLKTVWITGAGSGIGAAMARAFARAQYRVALTGRGAQALEEVAASLLAQRPGFDVTTLAQMIQPEDMASTALYVAGMNPSVAVHEILLAPVHK